MGSPLGPLLANVFMCHIENQLEQKSMIPSFYRRYVDDTLVSMPNTESATDFLQVLNNVHPSFSFTMELEHDGSIPLLGTVLTRCDDTLTTEVYRKPTDTELLLHFQSDVDSRYKKGLVNTMVNRAYRLQYCAKVMRAKCANFVLCLRELPKKIRPKIQASFRNVLSVISLKQRTKIRRIFMTRTKFPYQRDNSACSMRNITVHCADQYQAINVPFSREQSRSP